MLTLVPICMGVARVKNIGANLLPVIMVMLAYVITDSFSFLLYSIITSPMPGYATSTT